MRIVIVGSGRLGSRLADSLAKAGNHVTIVDENETKFNNLANRNAVHSYAGDIFEEAVQKQVFQEPVDIFVAVTGTDNVNIMIAQVVKKKFSVPRVLLRIFDPPLAEVYKEFGLETVCPTDYALAETLKLVKEIKGKE